jgi:hypothetical protein
VRVGGHGLDRGELLGAVRAQPLAVRVLAEVHDVRGPLGGGRGAERAEEEEERGGEPCHGVWSHSRRRSRKRLRALARTCAGGFICTARRAARMWNSTSENNG